jgi:thiopeptide-type bacteriocin biosynthesis protein
MSSDFFDPIYIERQPAFSFRNYNIEEVDKYLENSYFSLALKIASDSFWAEINKKKTAGLPLEDKEIYTLKKYINRIHFRATPFAFFSAVGTGKWSQNVQITEESEKHLVAYIHGQNTKSLSKKENDPLISCNKSYYLVDREFRYLHFENTADGELKWRIDSLPYRTAIRDILQFCNIPISRENLIDFIANNLKWELHEAEKILENLLKSQLLYSNAHLSSLGKEMADQKIDFLIDKKEASSIQKISLNPDIKRPFINLYHKQTSQIAEKYKNELKKAMNCLKIISNHSDIPFMSDFKTRFITKYDRQAVPFLKAIDPETGIGYATDDFNDIRHNSIVEDLPLFQQNTYSHTKWTNLHSLLFKKIQRGFLNIDISDEDLKTLESEAPIHITEPPSISIAFRLDDEDRIVVENCGGASAISLISRFTDYEDIADIAKKIADRESLNNQEVIFAEINCRMPDKHFNLHQRAKVYSHEICIGFTCTEPEQISLDDLLVFVKNDTVFLYSKRLKSRIIPRLSSAYNYRLNKLPAFNFLCDLQFEGIRHNFNFQLKDLFPDLTVLPRITYKNTILNLASWQLDMQVINRFKNKSVEIASELLGELINNLSIPDHIRLSEMDTYLVFDLSRITEKRFFIECLQRSNKPVLIQEYPFLKRQNGISGLSQFIAVKYNGTKSYEDAGQVQTRPARLPDKIDPLKWLCYKIYCHPNRVYELLTGPIIALATQLVKANEIIRWFYINYNDPEPHIRLRFKLRNNSSVVKVMEKFKVLYHAQYHGLIKEIILFPYQPEYERYGIKQMEKAEDLFFANSNYCVGLINYSDIYHPDHFYLLTKSVHLIFEYCNWDIQQRIEILRRLSAAGFQEFKETDKLKQELSKSYRSNNKALRDFIATQNYQLKLGQLSKEFHLKLSEYLKSLPHHKRDDVLIDIIHMHLNRLFNTSSRFQEIIIYYWLYKYYLKP